MKKTLITTAVAFALAAPFSVNAQLVPPTPLGNSDRDDQLNGLDNSVTSRGVINLGAQNPAPNTPVSSYSPVLNGSQNRTFHNALNDVNSDNSVTIGEDGVVAFAQDLDQTIADADLDHTVGSTDAVAATLGPGGNAVVENGVINVGAQNPAPNTSTLNNWTKLNSVSGGAFNNYGGIATANQNSGSTTSVGQAVVVQSNGSI